MMARTTQRQSPPQDNPHIQLMEAPNTEKGPASSLHPILEPTSDNDAGERPVREKLKKTSIASIPKYGIASARADAESLGDTEMGSQGVEKELSTQVEYPSVEAESRGRPVRKRSLDDFDGSDTPEGEGGNQNVDKSSGHVRKRSRDVRVGGTLNVEGRRRTSPGISVQEEDEDEGKKVSRHTDEEMAKQNTPIGNQDLVDEEMTESASSPRKKRSRDQFESETSREQKIAATDETKARRRSLEDLRPEETETRGVDYDVKEVDVQNGHVVVPKESSSKVGSETSSKTPFGGGFANTSAVSPLGLLAENKPSLSKDTSNQHTQTSSSAFAASGFANYSVSTISPFEASGSSTITSTIGPGPDSLNQLSESSLRGASEIKPQNATSMGFGTGPTLSGDAPTLAFGSTAISGFGSIAGSAFGGFGVRKTLSSFAAPIGDAQLGTERGNARPFGSSIGEDEVEGNSNDEDNSEEDGDEESNEEADARFHHVDLDTGEEGEETLFHVQGKLFCFDSNNWVERGLGTFKLNRAQSRAEEDGGDSIPTARFIMRAQQTHRVVLNTPVFKQMSIGDSKGGEPSGKTISFAAVENGKPVPYLLRMGKEDDIKLLYREVKRLQDIS